MTKPFSDDLQGIRDVVKALRVVSITLDLEDTLRAILEGVYHLIPFDAAGIYVLDPDSGEILAASERGYGADSGRPSSLSKARQIVTSVLQGGQSLTADVTRQEDYLAKRQSTETEMAVPIVGSRGRIIGALNIESDSRGAYQTRALELLAIFASGVAGSIERALLHRRILRNRRLEDELRLAREVMRGLAPQELPGLEGMDLGVRLEPWSEVGGDHYDFIPIEEKRCAVTITDVVGKGTPAALLVSTLRAALHSLARNDFSLRAVLRKANRLFCESVEAGKYATLFYAELDVSSRRLVYINAGHCPPVVVREDGDAELLETGGPPVGMFEETRYLEGIVHLDRGDLVALYTDGVTEAADAGDELYGTETLVDLLRCMRKEPASQICDAVFSSVEQFAAGTEQGDDRTLVVLKAL